MSTNDGRGTNGGQRRVRAGHCWACASERFETHHTRPRFRLVRNVVIDGWPRALLHPQTRKKRPKAAVEGMRAWTGRQLGRFLAFAAQQRSSGAPGSSVEEAEREPTTQTEPSSLCCGMMTLIPSSCIDRSTLELLWVCVRRHITDGSMPSHQSIDRSKRSKRRRQQQSGGRLGA